MHDSLKHVDKEVLKQLSRKLRIKSLLNETSKSYVFLGYHFGDSLNQLAVKVYKY